MPSRRSWSLDLMPQHHADYIAALLSTGATLKEYEPFRRMLFQGKGDAARALFDRADLPVREQSIRSTLKREGLWLR